MGIVTDIQRFSLNDGPGIRTTVFLKGCNLSCTWCHNPETLSMNPELLLYGEQCIGCGACVGFDVSKPFTLPPERESLTVSSASGCFSGALTVAGREMSVEEVMSEVKQDVNYYAQSGGGVTLSGGEVMMQPAFARGILAACKAEGIHTAVETNLAYDWRVLEGVLDVLDLVIADIKHRDNSLHSEYTGIGNTQVLDNVQQVAASGIPYILRTPIIPGVNDDCETVSQIAAFVASTKGNLLYYELLNFNPLGSSKYDGLGIENKHRDARPLTDDALHQLQRAAEACDIPVRVG